jgi:hypothetical protein
MASAISQTGLEQVALSAIQLEATTVEAIPDVSLEPTPEQLRYAGLLQIGMRLGLACLLVTFPLYLFGIIEPHVPLDKIDHCLTLSVEDYHREANIGQGWSWLPLVGRGDFMNFVGIVILASVTMVCYLAIVPTMLRRRDTVYAVLAILQVAVLGLAASGLITVGH